MNRRRGSWWVAGQLAIYVPRRYFATGMLWVTVIAFPVFTGLVLQRLFDQISQGEQASVKTIAWLLVLFVVLDLGRQALFLAAISSWPTWWNSVITLMRTNTLRSILCAPGPAANRLPASSGEALNRFRFDVEDIMLLADIIVDLTGDAVFAVIALTIMFHIDSRITLVIVLPLLAIVITTRLLSDRIKRTYSAARKAASAVSEQLGGLFSGVLSLKVAGAEAAAIENLRRHNAIRRTLEVRARLLTDMLDTLTASSVEISTGLVLLLCAPAMREGSFTVGDLALFTAYVGWLAGLPRRVGRTLYRHRQAEVAAERMTRMLASDEDERELVAHRPIYLRSPAPPAEPPAPIDAPFESLEVEGLVAVHPSSGRGVADVSLHVERGEFVVVTGVVGAGKTTLVRAILGLVRADAGTVRWNGRAIDDPGTFLGPPRVAYASQLPRLSSATLRENLVLGWPVDDGEVQRALELACLATDVDEMADGLDTMVGPRGMRLSGGQLQRAIAARALVREPELLVVDDLSSALDVETEQALWIGLRAERDLSLLVVSHRPVVLEQADRIVVLDQGRVRDPLPAA